MTEGEENENWGTISRARNGGKPDRSWDITGKGVPLAALIGAILLTATALLGLDRIMDTRIADRLAPILKSNQEMRGQLDELLKQVQGIREDMIRAQERERISNAAARVDARVDALSREEKK